MHNSARKIKNVAFFGDADVLPDNPVYKDAFETAKLLAEAGYRIVDGGGPGVMVAATTGARMSGGKTLTVTFDPKNAPGFEGRYVKNIPDREIRTKNYIERMFKLLENGDLFIIFKGGSGTISEFGTAWVLAKLYFGRHKPFILFGDFWADIIDVLRKNMNIDKNELSVFDIVRTKGEVLSTIKRLEKKDEQKIMTKLTSVEELAKVANTVRQDVIKMLLSAGSGHPAGSLSSTEIFVALYFFIMRHDPKKPLWSERDRLIVSHGHTCPAQYSVMAEAGYFSKSKLKTYAALGSPLQGHPERIKFSGIETTSGPLGCGLAQAAGYALAARMDGARFRVYCTTSDGEHNEGNHWEAVLFASKYKLANLTLFVDRNHIQIDGTTEQVLPLMSLAEKYRAFGWNAIEIDGHNFEEIIASVDKARKFHEGPTVVIANTIAGKGVSFMEGKPEWHAKAPNKKEAAEALKELKNVE